MPSCLFLLNIAFLCSASTCLARWYKKTPATTKKVPKALHRVTLLLKTITENHIRQALLTVLDTLKENMEGRHVHYVKTISSLNSKKITRGKEGKNKSVRKCTGKEGGRFACAYTLNTHLLFLRNWYILTQLKLITTIHQVNNVRSSQPSTMTT